jgi:hypothetical protein
MRTAKEINDLLNDIAAISKGKVADCTTADANYLRATIGIVSALEWALGRVDEDREGMLGLVRHECGALDALHRHQRLKKQGKAFERARKNGGGK